MSHSRFKQVGKLISISALSLRRWTPDAAIHQTGLFELCFDEDVPPVEDVPALHQRLEATHVRMAVLTTEDAESAEDGIK